MSHAGPDGAPAGVLYSATGKFYIGEAVRSAASSLRHNHVPHVLFADAEPAPLPGLTVSPFTPSGNPYLDKIANIRSSPFERTLYLDCDTFVVDEIIHVLDLLDHYDLVAAFAPGYRGLDDPGIPKAFYELNTGVLGWRRNERTAAFMSAWQQTYETWLHDEPVSGAGVTARTQTRRTLADQPAFRHCAWERGLSVFVLGDEYNLRLGFPTAVVDRVRVIHGEHPDLAGLAVRINEREGKPRTWPPPRTLTDRVSWRLKRAFGRDRIAAPSPRKLQRDAIRREDASGSSH